MVIELLKPAFCPKCPLNNDCTLHPDFCQGNSAMEAEEDNMGSTGLTFILLFLITLLFTIATTAFKVMETLHVTDVHRFGFNQKTTLSNVAISTNVMNLMLKECNTISDWTCGSKCCNVYIFSIIHTKNGVQNAENLKPRKQKQETEIQWIATLTLWPITEMTIFLDIAFFK